MHVLVWSLLLETDVGAKYKNTFNYIRIAAWNQNVYAKHVKCLYSVTEKTTIKVKLDVL